MQPSQYDIQREVEALRDIRRRSTTPGALAIDPDLPNHASPTSSTYWSGAPPPDDSSSSSHEEGTSSTDDTSDEPHSITDDPFHLFWVPASVHPEIAPGEFRAFLKEHSRSPPPGDGSTPVVRSGSLSSLSSSGLGRKKSMLSRQYRPSEHDGVGETEERIVPLSRNRSTIHHNQVPQLTISDLQRLEELAEEASASDDPSKLRTLLRRSLSLNISPSAIERMDNMPEMGDEADAPIIVPPPGQILRRAARTKIRKPSLPGDGGGHRFGASRRGASARAAKASAERSSTELSSSDHGDHDTEVKRPRALSNELQLQRPESFSEEGFIYDAYAHDEEEEHPSAVLVTTSPPPPEEPAEAPQSPPPQAQALLPELQTVPASLADTLGPVLQHPRPQRLLSPQPTDQPQQPSRTPSPTSPTPSDAPAPVPTPPAFLSSPPQAHAHRKEKDKKGLFGKWGSDKGGKKHAKDHQRADSHERVEKEKDSGFFGSLFGGKKSKDSENGPPPIAVHGGSAGREAAQALLGASKSSKNYQPPPSPGAQLINNYSRYPIHVERAIYRLSHIKLANPRRPLYEQVLISNLMFWYLGVINKAQTPGSPPNGSAAQANGVTQGEKEQKEREQREAEQREKELQERERQEREQREREMEMKKREASPRRGPLTKPAAGGAGGRRAEIPVKGPQYEMQHREMEQAYGGYTGYGGQPPQQQGVGMPMGRGPSPGPGQRMQQPPPGAPRLVQASSEPQAPDNFYYSASDAMVQQRLPPGAMPPVDQSGWNGASRQHSASPPPAGGARRSRSPPSGNYSQQSMGQQMYSSNKQQDQFTAGGGGRLPGRSLSATAISPSPSPSMNGKVRKGTSAYAAIPTHGRTRTAEGHQPYQAQANGMAEEEDVPLAVWQQRRK